VKDPGYTRELVGHERRRLQQEAPDKGVSERRLSGLVTGRQDDRFHAGPDARGARHLLAERRRRRSEARDAPGPRDSCGRAGQVDHIPDWAPKGRILFLRLSDVYSVNARGGGLTRLTKVGNIGDFALSPDGKSLAIDNNASQSIEIVPARGGGPRVTLLHPIPDFVPDDPNVALDWTPDGKALAMASSSVFGDQGSSLYIVNADGTGLAVVPNTGDVLDPAWRP